MTPIDFGGGMIFPNRYDRDQPDGPDMCDECEGDGTVVVEVLLENPAGRAERVGPCPACGGTGQVG